MKEDYFEGRLVTLLEETNLSATAKTEVLKLPDTHFGTLVFMVIYAGPYKRSIAADLDYDTRQSREERTMDLYYALHRGIASEVRAQVVELRLISEEELEMARAIKRARSDAEKKTTLN